MRALVLIAGRAWICEISSDTLRIESAPVALTTLGCFSQAPLGSAFSTPFNTALDPWANVCLSTRIIAVSKLGLRLIDESNFASASETVMLEAVD